MHFSLTPRPVSFCFCGATVAAPPQLGTLTTRADVRRLGLELQARRARGRVLSVPSVVLLSQRSAGPILGAVCGSALLELVRHAQGRIRQGCEVGGNIL